MKSVASLPAQDIAELAELLEQQQIPCEARLADNESGLETTELLVEDRDYQRACELVENWLAASGADQTRKATRGCPECQSHSWGEVEPRSPSLRKAVARVVGATVALVGVVLVYALSFGGCGPGYKNDPKVNAAIAQAKQSLTNFIAVLQSPNSNQLFFRVCAWFPSTPAFGCESVWANVWKYENGCFFGAVPEGNRRISLTNNQPVSIEASNVFDWAYMEFGKGMVGDFTARAIRGESNPQGGANGRQPVGSETNRASPAAASRRSP